MVMRRVFNHHVCLCVLSTAILAGLALMTSQTKVYAQAQNCKGVAGGDGDGQGDDKGDQPIVCDGMANGTGVRNGDGWGELSGDRDIDMNGHSGETAVTITGASTKIRIKSTLKVWDSDGGRSSNDNPAIKVDGGGELTVDDADVGGVKKGIVVENKGSSVTVMTGSIGVGKGMGPVIEVRDNGEVVLMKGVTVGVSEGSTGEVVINNGGDVTLMGTRFDNVTTGIVVKGNGTANVRGEGATITVKQGGMGGTGFKMEGSGTADVMELNINGGRGGGNRTGVEMKGTGGTLTMNRVTLKQLETGEKVTGSGVLKLEGGTTIDVKQGGTGLDVSNGTANVMGATITLQGDGSKGLVMSNGTANVVSTMITGSGTGTTGLEVLSGTANVTLTRVTVEKVQTGITKGGSGTLTLNGGTKINVVAGGKGLEVTGGTANVMGATITGSGNGMGTTGVEMKGSADVTLTRVTMKQVAKGITMTGGTLQLDGKSKINVKQGGTGLDVKGGTVMMTEGEITAGGTGTGTGINVTDGSGNVTLTRVTMKDVKTGVEMTGNGALTLDGGSITGSGSGVGINVIMGGDVTVKGGTRITGFATGIKMMGKGTFTVEEGTTINVKQGGTLTVSGGEIKGVKMGIKMEAGESLTVSGTTINFMGTSGVMVEKGVTSATLTGVMITGSGNNGTGIYAMGGNLTVSGGEIKGGRMGIMMEGNGALTVSGTTIQFEGDDGYGVSVGSSVKKAELTKVEIRGSGMGIYAMGGNLTVKEGTTITGVEEGIKMMGGVKNASLTGVTIKGAVRGIVMEGSGEFTVKDRTTINFTGEDGYGVKIGTLVSKASLTDVTITGSGSGGGVWVEGGNGNVTLTRVTISKVKAGIAMMGTGGTLTLEKGTRIEFEGGGYGIGVWGSVKKAELTGVTIEGSGGGVWVKGGEVVMKQVGITLQGSGTGIYMGTGVKNATLTGLTITGAEKGVAMEGKGTLTVSGGTTISFMGAYGVYVGSSVTKATLTGVTITGSGGSGSKGVGIYAMGGEVTMKEVDISNVGMGIWITGGSLTAKEGTKIQFTKDYGIKLGKGVTRAELKDVTIRGGGSGGYGVYAEGGVLMVSGGSITGVEEGIKMMGYGVLKVKGGTRIEFTGEYGYGVYAGKRVKNTSLIGVKIEGKGSGGYGVYAEGGSLTVSGGSITGVKAGIFAVGGGSLTVKEGTTINFMGSDGYGVYVGKRVMANLTDVTITGSGDGKGIEVAKGGAVWLKETHLRDVAKGMTIEEAVVVMEKGSVEFTKDYGISLTGGYVDLRKVRMTYTSDGPNANFIKIEGGKVAAEGITMTGNGGKGQGVKVAKGGVVWLKDTHFTNVKSGMTISEGSVFMFKGGITFKGEYGIYLSKGHALLSGFDITGPGGTSKTTAIGIGVVVSSLGEIMMRDVKISEVATGAYVTGYGLLVMDKGSITFKGKHGINLISGHALLNGVNIKGPGSGTGIELGYGQVLMKDTTFTNVDKAITVTQGDVRMEGGEIEFKGEHGILLGQGGVALMGVTMRYKGNSTTADFIKITGEDTTNAVTTVDPKTKQIIDPNTRKIIDPKKSAVVVAASLKIDGSGHGQALNVTNGGRVVLMNPTYTDVYTGMTITKGAVRMIEGSMEFTGGHGILLKRGHALLTNVTMEYKGHEQNTTFLKVDATKVVNSKNERVLNTADIRVTGIKIEGNGKGQGVYVTNGGRVMLQSALLSNVINGVSVANGEFWMKNGNIIFKGEHAVSLKSGYALLKGVIMEYKGNNRGAKGADVVSPNFIKVEGKGANLTAIKVMITGNEQGLGVKVSNGGHVTLKQSHVPIQSTIHITHNLIL
ncbi:right-handed parallel beta-helix repeat-containing protein [Bartonella schoenbuchensis]|uniref:right-handed parallel beta-helix repeat-containing protein n=1 Tax=Bartonella schoenbuchensis TaxID=165694 RepID=UPI0031451CBE